ncbi:hypothetical protein [Sphaerisporangium fuscum]|nr:hypothetical protein [Sphaerisporangium fuscum]
MAGQVKIRTAARRTTSARAAAGNGGRREESGVIARYGADASR